MATELAKAQTWQEREAALLKRAEGYREGGALDAAKTLEREAGALRRYHLQAMEGELIGLREAAARARRGAELAGRRGAEALAKAERELAEAFEGALERKTAELEAMR
jgi:hypothetical protein